MHKMKKYNNERISVIGMMIVALIFFVIAIYINFKDDGKVNVMVHQDEYVSDSKNEELTKDYNIEYFSFAKAVPTYENCSYYFECDKAYEAKIYYKKSDESRFKKAYEPVYTKESGSDMGRYKGSIVGLRENSEYNIVIEVYNGELVARKSIVATTWNSDVVVGKTIKLSEILNDNNSLSGLYIENLSGKSDSWIRIVADIEKIDATKQNNSKYKKSEEDTDTYIKSKYIENENINYDGIKDEDIKDEDIKDDNVQRGSMYLSQAQDGEISYQFIDGSKKQSQSALVIKNCEYILLEDATIRGGIINGIHIMNSSNVRVKNCDISSYGRVASSKDEYGVGYDHNGEVINYDSGICLDSSSMVTIEKNSVHSPNGNSNAWTKDYNSSSHPMGPNAMYIASKYGNNVIRYNSFVGDDAHRFNDVIEGWNNTKKDGGFVCDSDIYDNTLSYSNDDAIELDGAEENIRVYNNRIKKTMAGISIAPNLCGPSYIFRNEITNLSDVYGKTNYVIKSCGSVSGEFGKTFIFNNTFCTNGKIYGFYSSEKRQADIVSCNNIMVSREDEIIDNEVNIKSYYIDNDMMYSEKDRYFSNTDTFYEKNALYKKPSFVNEARGIFTLKKESFGIDSGKVIFGFTDGYVGSAPDMGCYEMKFD